ncbi:MAG: ferritin family protein [Candidatus Omnitrophica bacterium]|nr:ferritin family protein [Candidatus Omnitrophota bacterium]
MANIFNAAEAIDMGIEKERKRRDFYAYTAEQFKEQDMKDLFSKLKDWEGEHIAKFSEIRATLEESEATESFAGEFAAYVRATVDDILYAQVSKEWFVKNIHNPIEAILCGIVFEKDAILFFNELLRYMTPYHKEKVGQLIEEEKKHLVYLSELKTKYEK